LRRDGEWLVDGDGRRFPLESGVVRMLDEVDSGLAAELQAQKAALDIYLDERLLLTRYERTVARLVVEKLLGHVAGHVLDAGCGVGLLGRLYPQLSLIGVDASLPLLLRATQGYRLRVESMAESLPFEDGAFDAVLALNMLHHVVNPGRVIAEFARVLKAGGVLVAVDPRRVALVEVAKQILRRGDPAFATTHKAFEVEEYKELVGGEGAFVVEEYQRIGLLALCATGGLDQLGISRWLPGSESILRALLAADNLLSELPVAAAAGLNLVIRAQRRGDK
jgi:SAM-dependent methyltransferase